MKYTKTNLLRLERKRIAIERLGGKCSKCGYSKNLASLDFHHVDETTKEDAMGRIIQKTWKSFEDEIKKCVLLCKNCHAELHHTLLDFSIVDGKVILDNYMGALQTNCLYCGGKSYGHKYCSQGCSNHGRRRVQRPPKEELQKLIEENTYTALSKKFGVSDVMIKKWAKKYGIV